MNIANAEYNKNQQGFTVTELLISIGLGSLVSILMFSMLVYTYGGLIAEQTRANMVLESQLFLRRMTDDVRVANEIRATNDIDDPNNLGGWATSDPANILIITQPAVDSGKDFIYDDATGFPYQNEVVYFGATDDMYRRTLKNELAIGNAANTTCPLGTSGCPRDAELSENLKNMLFVFYDIDDIVTTDPELARSVSLTVNLERTVRGRTLSIENTTRVTLRNEK